MSVRERAVPDETDCVPVDRRIVCQTDIFWLSWKIRANGLGKITRGVEIDWIDVQVSKFTPSYIPRRSKSQKQQPIIQKEVDFGFPPDYTLPCLPTSAVKARPKELESVRW